MNRQIQWTIRPTPYHSEGLQGYLHRFLSTNGLRWDQIKKHMHKSGSQTDRLELALMYFEWLASDNCTVDHSQQCGRVLRYARFCPLCLMQEPFWRAEWEVLFYDVCHRHSTNLIDQCPACQLKITWQRNKLLECDCGAKFCEQKCGFASDTAASLAKFIHEKLSKRDVASQHTLINGLTLYQLQKAIHLFGAYGAFGGNARPQKIRNVDELASSWHLTSVAAEILDQWPRRFHHLVEKIQEEADAEAGWHIGRRFGHFYSYIYKGLKDGAFKPIRAEFEAYISQHWQAPLARRNRRLPTSVIESSTWVSLPAVAKQHGISPKSIRSLLVSSGIAAQVQVSQSGRRMISIKRLELDKITTKSPDIDLEAARNLLGICKKRARTLIPQLIPAASPPGMTDTKWRISITSLQPWLNIDARLETLEYKESETLTFKALLKHRHWSDSKVVAFLRKIQEGAISPIGKSPLGCGISSWIFQRAEIADWITPELSSERFTVTEAATIFNVKQEVAYSWVRREFISVTRNQEARQTFIAQTEIEQFKNHYVLARDLAAKYCTSSRSIRQRLHEYAIEPISGPGVDDSRQLLYQKDGKLLAALNRICF